MGKTVLVSVLVTAAAILLVEYARAKFPEVAKVL